MTPSIFWKAVVTCLFLVFGSTASSLSETARSSCGEIVAIETVPGTVVVEVPDGDQLYTVAGPVTPNAILLRNREPALLSDFRIGDLVNIRWLTTEQGHRITLLNGRESERGEGKGPGRCMISGDTVIGVPRKHIIKNGETLLDVARLYNLGFNEIQDLYPCLDPWIPPEGMELTLPTQWVLPARPLNGVVINAAELRLYMVERSGRVRTFPIGTGDRDWPTPIGRFRIGAKNRNPSWQVPPSLRAKYGRRTFPPGPGNPLGEYWIGLANTHYGIHGTDVPWSVGRLVTRGCIRLYPEDIRELFDLVSPGTVVEIVYEPVKIGQRGDRIYAEIHQDVYERLEDLEAYGLERLNDERPEGEVDLEAFRDALKKRNGLPVDISVRPSP